MVIYWHNEQGDWRCVIAYDCISNQYVFIIEDDSGNTDYLGSYYTQSVGIDAFINRMKEQQRAFLTQ